MPRPADAAKSVGMAKLLPDPAPRPTPAPPAGAHCCAGEAFELVGTAPKVGPFPELHTWRCRVCGHVETLEAPPEQLRS